MLRYLNPIIAQLVVILLILHTGIAYALPSGGHLNLCIGPDGNIDMGIDDCSTSFTQSQHDFETDAASGDHHRDCIDIPLGCATLKIKVLPSASIQHSKITFQYNQIPSIDKIAIGQSDNYSTNSLNNIAVLDGGAYPATYPTQKMTIVLII